MTFEFSEPRDGTPTQLTYERLGVRGTLTQWMEPPWRPDAGQLAPFAGTFRFEDPFEDEVLGIDLAFQRDAGGRPGRFVVAMSRADNLGFIRVADRR